MKIELHCHTIFSVDGSGTPETLVEEASAAEVGILSITEHNHLGSAARAARRAGELGILYINGVELDVVFQNRGYHILGLGVDPTDKTLNSVAARNHSLYNRRFEQEFAALKSLGFSLERSLLAARMKEHYAAHDNPALNMWLLRRVVKEEGMQEEYETLRPEATKIIAESGAEPLSMVDFETARDAIHAAGGVALLAHVGKMLPDEPDAQEELLKKLLAEGADGFELYHPFNLVHSDMERLESFGKENNVVFSGGSDCHHAPCEPPRVIGSCGMPPSLLEPLFQKLNLAMP